MSDREASVKSKGAAPAAAPTHAAAATSKDDWTARRSSTQVDRMLMGLGMRTEIDDEVQELARLIEHELAHDVPGELAQAADTFDVRRSFLRHRFVKPVSNYESRERMYSYLDTGLNLISIAAGVGASTAAALGAPKMITIVLGLLIGVLQSLSQWLKPSQRATRRGHAASELRAEAWNLLQGHDRYRDKSFNAGWKIFCDQVKRVSQREETDEFREAVGPPAKAGGR